MPTFETGLGYTALAHFLFTKVHCKKSFDSFSSALLVGQKNWIEINETFTNLK